MLLSPLQKHILLSCVHSKGGKRSRAGLENFYTSMGQKILEKDTYHAITKSLERLIDKELLVGYGVRTPHKWYIKEIRLTPKGRSIAKGILRSRQIALPFGRK